MNGSSTIMTRDIKATLASMDHSSDDAVIDGMVGSETARSKPSVLY